MKKLISLLIIVAVILHSFAILAFAADFSASNVDEDKLLAVDDDIGEIHRCIYLPNEEKVTVSGTISHDIMVTHNEYKIALFLVPEGKTLYDVVSAEEAKPLASADISIRFEFEVDAKTNAERFSRYAVVMYNDKGDVIAIDDPKHADVDTSYKWNKSDISAYKGVSTSQISLAADAGVGSVIVPVCLDKLLSTASTGYLYSIQGSYIYFDKAYVGELDSQIRAMSAIGAEVYLQFLIERDSKSGIVTLTPPDSADYALPDMRAAQSVNLIMAFADFICDRYDARNGSYISGIILGSTVDMCYAEEYGDFKEYSENYAHYLIVAGTAARAVSPSLDIVMPLSDVNTYGEEDHSAVVNKPSELLEMVCELFDAHFAGGFSFSTMIETSALPYGISDETLASGAFSTDGYNGINADNAHKYSEYLGTLKLRYESAPESFLFVWNVPSDISGGALSCAYAYSYFKLLTVDRIKSFVVSFSQSENKGEYGGYSEISEIMKYIDTSDSFKITEPQLKKFGVSNWYAVINDMYGGRFDTRRVLQLGYLSSMPDNIIGNYAYYDFSYYTSVSEWFAGSFCDSLKINYCDISGRSLQAHFTGKVNAPTEFSEIYCAYEYPENFVYTPYMSLDFSIENDDGDRGALYEVRIAFGSGSNRTEMTQLCRSYEKTTFLFDMSDFCEVSMADYIRIGVRSLTDGETGYKLCLASIHGYSDMYVSSELETLIAEERLKIRDAIKSEEENEESEENTFLVIAGIAVVVAVIGVGIFMCFKREEEE